jgi:pimeloyl-ACP methyl ester carboxylesterase
VQLSAGVRLHLMQQGPLDDLQVPTATIVGHSMGSFVARTAELGRDRVDALVLIGSAATPRNDVVRSLARDVEHFTDPLIRSSFASFS